MLVLTIRTDNPQAEIGLYEDGASLFQKNWQAHRELAETIHNAIDEVLRHEGVTISEIDGIIFFKGPGSFTGLRIGASVANALSSSLKIPIVGEYGDEWVRDGLARLIKHDDRLVIPEYGMAANITPPRK